mmetsp:Transcript_5340/g.18055  ORF Transcript_5340/g.18055 Transcript_5340/m.18055 type:complete len:1124 (+) Transcript_5340:72-3443(+)
MLAGVWRGLGGPKFGLAPAAQVLRTAPWTRPMCASAVRTVKLPPALSAVLEEFRESKSISRTTGTQEMMKVRVQRVLLLCSDYDSYTFEEEGMLRDLMHSEYAQQNLRRPPVIDRVTSVEQVMDSLQHQPYDLVISLLRTQSMGVGKQGSKGLNLELFVEQVKKHSSRHIPILLLALNPAELSTLDSRVDESLKIHVHKRQGWERGGYEVGIQNTWLWPFLWQGNLSLFTAMFKAVEDRINAPADTKAGAQVIILVEDNVKFYSQYLPIVYNELIKQASAPLDENMTHSERLRRMQSRPKVLLCTNYEEATEIYDLYRESTMAVITDAAFSRGGQWDPEAGMDFAKRIRADQPDLDVVLQSSELKNQARAEELGCTFIHKHSPALHLELRSFFEHTLGFGPIRFPSSTGTVLAQAHNIATLMRVYATLPDDVIDRVGRTSVLSKWFRARAEPTLAKAFAHSNYPADFQNYAAQGFTSKEDALRHWVLTAMFALRNRLTDNVSDYTQSDQMTLISRVGKGALGGKGRGFRLLHNLMETFELQHVLPEVDIKVPQCLILATDVFDRFMESNDLLQPVLRAQSDAQIEALFEVATLPADAMEALRQYAERTQAIPLAVRSSSLFEDAFQQPFAGVYKSYMLHNSAPTVQERVATLASAVKSVFASTFTAEARSYAEASQLSIANEKMAVIIQAIAGKHHGNGVFAPSIAGVANAVDFYPRPHTTSDDGCASIAPGFGSSVVDGAPAMTWSLGDPEHTVGEPANFMVLRLPDVWGVSRGGAMVADSNLEKHPPSELSSLGLLHTVPPHIKAPVVEVQTHDVHGEKVVFTRRSKPAKAAEPMAKEQLTEMPMAQVVRGDLFPFSQVLSFFLQLGTAALSCPVELEFAVNLRKGEKERHELNILQIRPMSTLIPDAKSTKALRFSYLPTEQHAVATSRQALGHGRFSNLTDIVYVPPESFSADTADAIAREISAINDDLKKQGRKYVLVGPGRWGTADRKRGIPVDWSQIDGSSFIIESSVPNTASVPPSQGAHFFQNIMSFGLGYMTVDTRPATEEKDVLDYKWLDEQPKVSHGNLQLVKHVQLPEELEIVCDGLSRRGVIMKPGKPFATYVDAIDAMMKLTVESGGA